MPDRSPSRRGTDGARRTPLDETIGDVGPAAQSIRDGPPSPPVTAVLLAAGRSSRMGTPKPLLPWDGRSLVRFQVAQLQAAGASPVVVVTGHDGDAVAAELRDSGALIAHNPDYAAGRAGSVRVGLRAAPDGRDVLVLNVDQPRPAALVRAVLDGHRAAGGLISVPVVNGRHGHPAVFAAALLPELREVTEETEGLRAVMRRHAGRVAAIPVGDARALVDVNTPEAYRAALQQFGLAPATP